MKKKSNEITLSELLAWCWIGIILLVAIFKNGIFDGVGINKGTSYQFEAPLLYTVAVSCCVLIWGLAHLFYKDRKLTRGWLFGIAAIVMPIVYLLSSFQAESHFMAKYGVLNHFAWFAFFLAGILLFHYPRIIRWFPTVYFIFGSLILLYGFATLFGNAYLLDALSQNNGVRMASIFQYPNALAVLLLTLWLFILLEMDRANKKWVRVAYGMMLVPVCVSFLLTLSRGAMVVLPIIAVVVIAMLRFKQQVMFILYSILGMGIALTIYSSIAKRGVDVINQIQQSIANNQPIETASVFSSPSITAWGLLIGASLLQGIIVYAIHRYIEPKLNSKLSNIKYKRINYVLPTGLLIVFILGAIAVLTDIVTRILPPIIRSRVENINWQTHSIYERLTMYKDAFKIWKDHPIIGAGGGTWEAVYQKYQSYPYTSMQTHSFVTQILVETGLVGFLLILGLIIVAIVSFVNRFKHADDKTRNDLLFYFITPVTILLHATFDFEMSYLLFGFIVFLCLGVLAGASQPDALPNWFIERQKWLRRSVAGALVLLTGYAAFLTFSGLYGHNQLSKSIRLSGETSNLQMIVSPLIKGTKSDSNPMLLYQTAYYYYQGYEQLKDKQYLSEASRYINRLKKAEPNFQLSIDLQYKIALGESNPALALEILGNAIENAPFQQQYYEQIFNLLLPEWNAAYKNKDAKTQKSLADEIISFYNQMQKREDIKNNLPSTVIPREFVITNSVRAAVGQVAFYEGNYSEALQILKKGINTDITQQDDRNVARFYLASLSKLGQQDQEIYEKLIQVDPTEADKLKQLENLE